MARLPPQLQRQQYSQAPTAATPPMAEARLTWLDTTLNADLRLGIAGWVYLAHLGVKALQGWQRSLVPVGLCHWASVAASKPPRATPHISTSLAVKCSSADILHCRPHLIPGLFIALAAVPSIL